MGVAVFKGTDELRDFLSRVVIFAVAGFLHTPKLDPHHVANLILHTMHKQRRQFCPDRTTFIEYLHIQGQNVLGFFCYNDNALSDYIVYAKSISDIVVENTYYWD